MHNDDAKLRRGGALQLVRHALDLLRGQLAVLVPVRPRRVDADYQQMRGFEHRLEVFAEAARVVGVGSERA